MLSPIPIHGFVIECEKIFYNENGEQHDSVFFKVNAKNPQEARMFVAEAIVGSDNLSIKQVVAEYIDRPFTGIMR